MPAIRARPYVPSVVMPACGPVRLMAGTPSACSAIESERRALVLAGREQDVELARVGLVGDRRGQAEQLVGRVAHGRDDHDEVVAGGALARDPPRDPLDPVRARRPMSRRTSGRRGGRACPAFYCRVSHAPGEPPGRGSPAGSSDVRRCGASSGTRPTAVRSAPSEDRPDVPRPRQPTPDRPDRRRRPRRAARRARLRQTATGSRPFALGRPSRAVPAS